MTPAVPAPVAPVAAPDLAAVRQTIHASIERVGNAAFLQAVAALLQTQTEAPAAETDFWDDLSPEWQAELLRRQANLEAGRGIPFEQAMAKLLAALPAQAEADFWGDLSPATKDLISRSKQSLAAGRGVPLEEAMGKLGRQ